MKDPPANVLLPTLTTPRLVLRPPHADDAEDLVRLAGDRVVASTTIRIPHPYVLDDARRFIRDVVELAAAGEGVHLAIMRTPTTVDGAPELVGATGLSISEEHGHAELGYWIGAPFWGRGYATEAARAFVDWAFETLDVERIHAHHMASNPASGRILEKIGMQREGLLREHFVKWGRREDLVWYGLLRREWAARASD